MVYQYENPKRAFSPAAIAEAQIVAESIIEGMAGRPAAQGITIDNPTSRDLDDAFWLERLPQGGYQLQVSIADVGSWITPRLTPALDQAAFTRAFTRYEGERYRPMLPRPLSEDRLSLLEGRPRPAITIAIPLDAQLYPGEPDITLTTLSSSKRFSYAVVERELDHAQTDLAPMLQLAYEIAQGLLRGRRLRGALAVYNLPAGWITTEEGFLHKLGTGERYKAQLITAEFMILANQAFARFFANKGILALYRNQKARAIAPERLTLLQMLDMAVQQPTLAFPERVSATFQLAMERARYAPTLEGHFGLNLPAYIHMTSPIRRYSDLVNQRILLSVLNEESSPYPRAELEHIAASINEREQAVKEAKQAYFLDLHTRRVKKIVEEDAQDPTASSLSLSRLNARTFHSVIRIAAEGYGLVPAVEQEILRRLEARQLDAHDLFTLVFRFNTSEAAWDRVRTAALQALQRTPEYATSILLMGHQTLGWSAPAYEFSTLVEHTPSFQARVTVNIAGREYVSTWQQAQQKNRAKQLAGVELLICIARGSSEASLDDSGNGSIADGPGDDSRQRSDARAAPIPRDAAPPNYKGQLQEQAQAHRWERPVYIEESRSGPPHAPLISVEGMVVAHGRKYSAKGEGKTKVQAEQRAAQQLLDLIPQPPLEAAIHAVPADNQTAMSTLHEMQQKAAIRAVTYTYERLGQQHDELFSCVCAVLLTDDHAITGSGTGKTKRQAAQAAAFQALGHLEL
ncbi:MAG TPA: RNB domain-containing ribonuclease [Ktedonobacterales bacterium]|jgi:ribonuclease R